MDLEMSRKHYSTEQTINLLRQAEVLLSQGKTIDQMCRSIGVSNQTYYKWRSKYGGLQMSQAKKLKALEQENQRLKKAVAELTLDKLILQEASKGNF